MQAFSASSECRNLHCLAWISTAMPSHFCIICRKVHAEVHELERCPVTSPIEVIPA